MTERFPVRLMSLTHLQPRVGDAMPQWGSIRSTKGTADDHGNDLQCGSLVPTGPSNSVVKLQHNITSSTNCVYL
jgi:hypothetical protein